MSNEQIEYKLQEAESLLNSPAVAADPMTIILAVKLLLEVIREIRK